MKIVIRNFKSEDVVLISRLIKKCSKAVPDSSTVQAEVYNSPEFEGGKMFFALLMKRTNW